MGNMVGRCVLKPRALHPQTHVDTKPPRGGQARPASEVAPGSPGPQTGLELPCKQGSRPRASLVGEGDTQWAQVSS